MFNSEIVTRGGMAKTDSFFIRGKVTQTGSTFLQTTQDLGAFVDALGKSVLRIHNIEFMVTDDSEPSAGPSIAANNTLNVGVQLTTQTQSGLVTLEDKSVIASARWVYSRATNAYSAIDSWSDVKPVSPLPEPLSSFLLEMYDKEKQEKNPAEEEARTQLVVRPNGGLGDCKQR